MASNDVLIVLEPPPIELTGPDGMNETVDKILMGQLLKNDSFLNLMGVSLCNNGIEMYEEFGSASTDLARVEVLKQYFPYGQFGALMEEEEKVFVKNDNALENFLSRGYLFATASRHVEALRCYSVAFAFCPTESLKKINVLLRRSSVFESMKEYLLAISDIELALELISLPEKRLPLEEKKAQLTALLPVATASSDVPRQEARNQMVSSNCVTKPFLADWISLAITSEMDKFIVVNDVGPARTLMIEQPFVFLMNGELEWQTLFCAKCCKKMWNPVPCHGCVFMLYCSEKCRLEHQDEGHQFECRLFPYLHKLKLPPKVHLSLKAICKAGPDILNNFYKKFKHGETTYFPPSKQVIGYFYCRVLGLQRCANYPNEQPSIAWFALALVHLLRKTTSFFTWIADTEKDDFETFLASLIVQHSETFPLNTFAILAETCIKNVQEHLQNPFGGDEVVIGYGVYPMITMLRHSCAPSVFRKQLPGGRIAIISSRNFKKGENPTLNYVPPYYTQPIEERRRFMSQFYRMECDCKACTENWHVPLELEIYIPLEFLCPHCLTEKQEQHDLIEQRSGVGVCQNCRFEYYLKSLKRRGAEFRSLMQEAKQLLLKNMPHQSIPILIECINFYQMKTREPSGILAAAQMRLMDSFDLLLNTTNF